MESRVPGEPVCYFWSGGDYRPAGKWFRFYTHVSDDTYAMPPDAKIINDGRKTD